MSKIVTVATANPEQVFTQKEVLACARSGSRFSARALAWYERFLLDRGIETRRFGLDDLNILYSETADEAIGRFQTVAARLGVSALTKALECAHITPKQVDGLIVTTCTGYLCPGLTSYIAQGAKLRSDIFALDLVGIGCGAAIPALRSADHFLKSHSESVVAVVCVEVCSSAFCWGEEIDLILSNSIFSDGAACALMSNKPDALDGWMVQGFESILWPEYRDDLRFKNRDARLCNVIDRKVPRIAALALQELMHMFEMRFEGAFKYFAVHPGGRTVLDEIEEKVIPLRGKLSASRAVLRRYGNMSSPSVLFVLRELSMMTPFKDGDSLLLFSFGAGFSAFGAALEFRSRAVSAGVPAKRQIGVLDDCVL